MISIETLQFLRELLKKEKENVLNYDPPTDYMAEVAEIQLDILEDVEKEILLELSSRLN